MTGGTVLCTVIWLTLSCRSPVTPNTSGSANCTEASTLTPLLSPWIYCTYTHHTSVLHYLLNSFFISLYIAGDELKKPYWYTERKSNFLFTSLLLACTDTVDQCTEAGLASWRGQQNIETMKITNLMKNRQIHFPFPKPVCLICQIALLEVASIRYYHESKLASLSAAFLHSGNY